MKLQTKSFRLFAPRLIGNLEALYLHGTDKATKLKEYAALMGGGK
jgi:hypothetical protein